MDYLFKLPKIFNLMTNINWDQIYNNIDSTDLELTINKLYYSDQSNQFNKSFGFKVKNMYDLSLMPINQIIDSELVVDQFGFGFSYYDLKRLQENSLHPYNKQINLNKTLVLNKTMTLFSYYQQNMSCITKLPSLENLYQVDDLCNEFEKLINNEFFTTNLLTIYSEKHEHLDYTVGLLCYILSIIEDYHIRYISTLKNNYCQEKDKYHGFLKLFISFLDSIKEEYNNETYHYVCIIIFKVLQYRYNLITEGEELFNLLKNSFDNRKHDELYWSIVLDRPNFVSQKRTGTISLININIDNIFSNCEYGEYFYTLLHYLQSVYMCYPTHQNNQLVPILNYYKTEDNYSYLDLIRYFAKVHNQIELSNNQKDIILFFKLIQRYYLKTTAIYINNQGKIVD